MGHGSKVESAWHNMNKAERAKDNWMSGDPGGGSITVGKGTNIQDGCIVTAKDDHTIIGVGVTVGHCDQIHSSFCIFNNNFSFILYLHGFQS